MGGSPPVIELIHDGVRLNIGCGQAHYGDGYINCDLYPGDNVDMVFDACKEWPYPDNSARSIYSSHTLEHLTDPVAFFQEAWRVLKPGATMQLAMPYGHHRAAWWDVTHLRPWFPESFAFLQPGYNVGSRNLQHVQWKEYFHVADTAQRVSARFAPLLRWKLARRLLMPWLHLLNDVIEELYVYLIALKTPQQIDQWVLDYKDPMLVPSRYVMYAHHWYGTRPPDGPVGLIPLSVIVLAPGGFHDWGRSGPSKVRYQKRSCGLGYD